MLCSVRTTCASRSARRTDAPSSSSPTRGALVALQPQPRPQPHLRDSANTTAVSLESASCPSKQAYYGHTVRKQGSCLEKEIMQGTVPGARRRERPRTAWMNNIKTWTYYGHTMRKQDPCLEKKIVQGTMPGTRRRGRPRTAWMNNITTWTGLPVEDSIRMTEDGDKWRRYVRGVANPRIEDS